MAKFQAMHKYFAVFLALVACHESLLTHGRKIKALNTDSSVNVPTPSSEKNVESPTIPKQSVASFGEYSGADNTNAFRPTTPGSSPGVGHKKEHEDMKAMVVVQSPEVKAYVTEGSKDDFAPATPGHSPGVGHGHHQNKNGKLN